MKKYLTAAACIMLLTANVYAEDLNDQYPKTYEEKKSDEIGSVIGPEGLKFHVGGGQAEGIVAAQGNYNKELWKAAQEMADVAPLSLVDAKNGELSTDWYSPQNSPNTSNKIVVKVTGAKLAPSSLDVKVLQRTMKNGRWVEENAHSKTASKMSAKILKRAKEISNK